MTDNENLIVRLEIVADEMKDLKRYPMEGTIRETIGLLKSNSSERPVQPKVREQLSEILNDAVNTDGAHHKQYYLEKIAEMFEIVLDEHDEGVIP